MVNRLPGTDLDVEIARRVLGFKVWLDEKSNKWSCLDPNIPNYRVALPQYSTNTDHAYRIVNKIQEQGLVCHFGSTPIDDMIQWRSTVFDKSLPNIKWQSSTGMTLAHAICLASLANLEETNRITFEKPIEKKSKTIPFPKKD